MDAESAALPRVSVVTARPLEPAFLATVPDIGAARGEGCRWQFDSHNVTRTIAGLMGLLEAAQIEVVELHVQKASLEDIFIELTAS